MRKKIRITLFIVCTVVGGLLTTVLASTSGQLDTTDIPEAAVDSIPEAETVSIVEKASAGYKNLKFIQYDGVMEDELYPAAMEVYDDVRGALSTPALEESDITRFKGILLDLSDMLRKGSIYYSNKGDMGEMTRYATAYVDLRMDPMMKDMNFSTSDASLYPSLVYCAASGAYNNGNYDKAVDYLMEYLNTGETDRREQVSLFLAQACLNAKCTERGIDRIISATDQYPANFNLLMLALQNCLEGGYTDRMQPLLTKALMIHPDDEQLLNAQARLFEDENNYNSAIDIYQKLYEMKPNSLSVNQHLALCYYNLGADYYNKSLMESDEKTAKKYSRQSQAYLSNAQTKLETVVENDPSNPKYLKALAITYGCLGNKPRLDEINVRLQALGIPAMTLNGMPESITFADTNQSAPTAKRTGVPDFQEFARGYVEKELASWTKRGEFEKIDDYEKRVNQDNVYQQYQMLCKKAESDYLQKYAGRLRISDLSLEPYDVENESYMINSAMGPIVVRVPLKNKEAETFKSSWNTIQLRNPKYYIRDNHVAIASVELVTSAGKSYRYDSSQAANYDYTDVAIDMQSFINQGNKRREQTGGSSTNRPRVLRAKSDVDENIPLTTRKAENTIALIISNEDYKQVTNVEAALNDGEAFAKYCTMTLGVPEGQVLRYENVTYAEMLGAVRKLKQLAGALGDNVDVIFYYAGHGFPDEGNKDAYLLPVDGDGFTTATSYPLKKLYSDLSESGAENVMVFLDACFSGATRDGGMLAEARGVALKPRVSDPEGNMFVLSAASDQETALPYKEKNHGLFTYYLLKKIQETKGNVTLQDLSRYVEEMVKKNSLTVNSKLQTPRTSVSGKMKENWSKKRLRP